MTIGAEAMTLSITITIFKFLALIVIQSDFNNSPHMADSLQQMCLITYGNSRVGKTTTGLYLVNTIADAYDENNPYAFRAVHYEAGAVSNWSGNEQKRGLKSLYNSVIGKIDEGLYRTDPAETIANNLVHALMRKNIQIVCVDEAGNLSIDAIRGILMAYDVAKNINYNLSFIFIGMDDLPVKVTKLPQINGRIHEWCYFQPYEIEEIAPILKNITPIFENIDIKKPKDFEIVECIYELCGGYLGFIIPFLQKVERYLLFEPQEISIMYLRAVFLRTQIDKNTSINKSMEIHSGKPIVKTSIKKNRSKRRSKL